MVMRFTAVILLISFVFIPNLATTVFAAVGDINNDGNIDVLDLIILADKEKSGADGVTEDDMVEMINHITQNDKNASQNPYTSPEEGYKKITFDTDGGSFVEAQAVLYGETVFHPEDPIKENSIFEDWYTDKNHTEKYDFTVQVTEDISLYAKWTDLEANIELVAGNYSENVVNRTVDGTVSCNDEIISVEYKLSGNNKTDSGEIILGENGEFSVDILLEDGTNNFTVTIETACGSTVSESTAFTYDSGNGYDEYDPRLIKKSIEEDNEAYYISNLLNLYFFEETSFEERVSFIETELGGEVIGYLNTVDMIQVLLPAALKNTDKIGYTGETAVENITLEELEVYSEVLLAEYTELLEFVCVELIGNTISAQAITKDPWTVPIYSDAESNQEWLVRIDADDAWKYENYNGLDYFSDIKIGVVDSGFYSHSDLKSNLKILKSAFATPHAHGTLVAGIIAAEADNGIGGSGVLHNNGTVLGYDAAKSGGSFSEKEVYNGLIKCVENGAKVINFSLGPEKNLEIFQRIDGKKSSLEICKLLEKGYDFIVLQAAGNGVGEEGSKRGIDYWETGLFCSVNKSNCSSSGAVSKQDIMDRIIIVSALARSDMLFSYSNGGKGALNIIAAPAYNFTPRFDDNQIREDLKAVGEDYLIGGGTSSATPVVSAVCGLVWSVNPSLSGANVVDIVMSSTDGIAAANPDSNTTGGMGIVNALNSVEAAIDTLHQYTVNATERGTESPIRAAAKIHKGGRNGVIVGTVCTADANGTILLPKLPYGQRFTVEVYADGYITEYYTIDTAADAKFMGPIAPINAELYKMTSEKPVTIGVEFTQSSPSVSTDNAVVAARVKLSGADSKDINAKGITLYDNNGNFISDYITGMGYQATARSYADISFNIKDDLNCTLTANTAYKYVIYVIINGIVFRSDTESFTTKNHLTVISESDVSYRFTVPSGYRLDCYSSAAAETSGIYVPASNISYMIYATKEYILSDGSVRYRYLSEDGHYVYFKHESFMTVRSIGGSVVVYFDPNGGVVTPGFRQINKYDSSGRNNVYGTLPIPTREGYTFNTWSDSPIVSGMFIHSIGAKTPLLSNYDHTLYAIWRTNWYSLKLVSIEGADTKTIEEREIKFDSRYGELPTVSREGYIFGGWYTSFVGGEEITAESVYTTASDTVLYARWIRYDDAIASGKCGDDLSWSIHYDGTLKIIGSGAMYDFEYNTVPWRDYSHLVKVIILDDRITHIGNFAFWTCMSANGISIPDALESIGENAGCPGREIVLPSGIKTMEFGAFSQSLETVSIPGSLVSAGPFYSNAFSNCDNLKKIYYDGDMISWLKACNSEKTAALVVTSDGSEWFSGSGTENDPYLIENPEDLIALSTYVNECSMSFSGIYFKMTDDIRLNSKENVNNREPEYLWTPIGGKKTIIDQNNYTLSVFCGNFDGDGNTVYGMYIDIDSQQSHKGLFGSCYNASVKNLTIDESLIFGSGYIGAFAGEAVKSNFVNCTSKVDINRGLIGSSGVWDGGVGGIVGVAFSTTISNCHNNGLVVAFSPSGGIVGRIGYYSENVSTLISDCSNSGIINSYRICAGGIAGEIMTPNDTVIERCTNSGAVASTSAAGGITGKHRFYQTTGKIEYKNCLNSGIVEAAAESYSNDSLFAGGIIGQSDGDVTVSVCLNAGAVDCYSESIYNARYADGIIGNNCSDMLSVVNSYYNAELIGDGCLGSGYGIALSEDELADVTSFDGFDFTNTWEMGVKHPILKVFGAEN